MYKKTALRALLSATEGLVIISISVIGVAANPQVVVAPVPASLFLPVVVPYAEPSAVPVPVPVPIAVPQETRPPLRVPQLSARQVPRWSPTPVVVAASTGSLHGKASWYCNYDDPNYQRSVCHYKYPDVAGPDMYAAACGKLRRAMGSHWRGQYVNVTGNGRTITVRLIDWCGSEDKTIDLYRDSMDGLHGGGVVDVIVSW